MRGAANGSPCRRRNPIGCAFDPCPARSPTRFSWTRFSNVSRFGRRASIPRSYPIPRPRTAHGCCPTRCACRCDEELARFAQLHASASSHGPTSSCRCSWRCGCRRSGFSIADDVGIGKTIEAGLILRELIDRGEIERFAVLCPPHLVEQWTGELKSKFDLDAVAVTASSAPRLERGLTISQTLFDAHPYTVVSLDYIKSDRRRESFARACPALVVVDEAHACVGTHRGRQQRFELLSVPGRGRVPSHGAADGHPSQR